MDEFTLTGVDELPDEPEKKKRTTEPLIPEDVDHSKLVNDLVIVLGHPYAKERGRINPKTGRIYTPSRTVKYQKSVMRACYDCRLHLEPSIPYTLSMDIFTIAKHGDVTNIIKAVEDGINMYAQRIGIEWDDKQIKHFGEINLEIVKFKDEEKVVLILRPYTEEGDRKE